ncbi:MAG: invasion associated locus B family protein [Rhodospirillales bacterium]
MASNRLVIAALVVAVLLVGAGGVYLMRERLGLSSRPVLVGQPTPISQPIDPRLAPPVPQPVAEQFEKWRVQCVQDTQSRQFCRAEQVVAGADGAAQLAIFASPPAAGRAAQAVIVPPWAVLIDRGLTLQIDAQSRFNVPIISCRPTGCWAEFPIDDTVLEQLRHGTTLQVAMVAADGAPIVIAVPLAGFAPAYERLLQKSSR